MQQKQKQLEANRPLSKESFFFGFTTPWDVSHEEAHRGGLAFISQFWGTVLSSLQLRLKPCTWLNQDS